MHEEQSPLLAGVGFPETEIQISAVEHTETPTCEDDPHQLVMTGILVETLTCSGYN